MNIRPRGQGADLDIQVQDAAPLAGRLRPKTVEQVVGQDHITTGPDALGSNPLENIIFWGPPG